MLYDEAKIKGNFPATNEYVKKDYQRKEIMFTGSQHPLCVPGGSTTRWVYQLQRRLNND